MAQCGPAGVLITNALKAGGGRQRTTVPSSWICSYRPREGCQEHPPHTHTQPVTRVAGAETQNLGVDGEGAPSLGVGLMWKCTQSPAGDKEERAGSKEMEGRAGARGVSDSQSPASQDHYPTMCTAEEVGSHTQLGEAGKDDTNAPKSRDHNQHARGAQLSPWSGWGGQWARPREGSLV